MKTKRRGHVALRSFVWGAALAFALSGVGMGSAVAAAPSQETNDIPALLKSGALKGKKMVLASWGGAFTAATVANFVKPFEAATGVRVTVATPGGGFAAKLEAQERAKLVQWDLLDAPGGDGDILASEGYIEDFPPSLIAALKPLVRPDTLLNPWRLAYGQTPHLIVCNPAVMKRCPLTPKEFWDVKDFPGPRGVGMWSPFPLMVFAEEAAGVPRDKLFPLNVPLAVATLEKLKPYVTVWPQSPTQEQQILSDGEVGALYMGSTRAYVVKQSMPDIKISWDGAATNPDGWVVPKAAPDAEVAFAFILWVAEHPEHQAKWTSTIFSLTPAKGLEKMLSPEVREATSIAQRPVLTPHEVLVKQRLEVQKGMQKLLSGG